MKSLQRVQKIMSVLKVLSAVVFVFSIIGASICLITTLIIASSGSESTVVKEVVNQYIESGLLPQGISSKEVYNLLLATMMSSTLLCISEAIIYYFVKGMKIRRIGKLRIFVSLATLIICALIISIMSKNTSQITLSNSSSIIMGILYLIIACFLDYGSDINHLPNNDTANGSNNDDNFHNEENN